MLTPQEILMRCSGMECIVNIAEYIVGKRIRIDGPAIRAKIEADLTPDILDNGLIQPIIINFLDSPIEGNNIYGDPIYSAHVLIAGWSRTVAFTQLGMTQIPCVFRRNVPLHECLALELAENIRRNDMTWQEHCIGIAWTHREKVRALGAEGKSWGYRETGKLIGQSLAHVGEALTYVRYFEANDAAITNASSVTEARRIIFKRKEDEAAKQLKAYAAVDKPSETVHKVSTSVLHDLLGDDEMVSLSCSPGEQVEKIALHNHVTSVPITSFILQTDCVRQQADGSPSWFDQRDKESVDLVYTDHPFAIDMNNLDLVNLERTEDEHEIEDNLEQMPLFLKGAYKVLRDKCYLLYFCDMKHWEKLVQLAEGVGFTVQPYPVIWVKTHRAKNQAAHCWYPKNIEYVMVCRKGKATMNEPADRNYYICNNSKERTIYTHPFCKPHEFTKWLLKPIVREGMTALDCYMGEGSMVNAMLEMGLNVIGLEKVELHYNKAIEHFKKTFQDLIPGKVEFS